MKQPFANQPVADRDAENPWLPVSQCGSSCIPPESDRVSGLRLAWRITALVLVVLVGALLIPIVLLCGRRSRVMYCRVWARRTLAASGMRLEVIDHRPAHGRRVRGTLIVANHISFFDVLAVAAIAPSRFVAKAEVLSMGAMSLIPRCFGVLAHRRGDLRSLRPGVEQVTRLLDRGRPVAVFPEGTTWCGAVAGRFRPAFFQAAIDAGVPVLPMRLAYHRAGRPATSPGFLGDDELGDTFGRILRARELTVTVTVHPLELPAGDRRVLAARCDDLISWPGQRALPPSPAITPRLVKTTPNPAWARPRGLRPR